MIVLDGFLQDWEAMRTYADGASYSGAVNPVDGVEYPGICAEIPCRREVVEKLSRIVGTPVSPNAIFMRLSLAGVPVPHQAHTDSTMGRWSLMLYLNRPEDCQGGTSFLQHKATGMFSDPTPEQLADWQRDTNNPEAWAVHDFAVMKPNRACIFDSHLMHRAEPCGGFGDSPKNGRLVLTCFFDPQ